MSTVTLDLQPTLEELDADSAAKLDRLVRDAIALTHGFTVITNNTDEFKRVPGLRVEDWSA